MSRLLSSPSPPVPKDAAWLDWGCASHCVQITAEHAALRPLHAMGVRGFGQDRLKERFAAGTPCSSTHLVWIVTHGAIEVDWGNDLKSYGLAFSGIPVSHGMSSNSPLPPVAPSANFTAYVPASMESARWAWSPACGWTGRWSSCWQAIAKWMTFPARSVMPQPMLSPRRFSPT